MALQVLLHSVFLALVCLFGMRDLQRMDAATMVLSRSNSVDEPEPGRAPYRDSPNSRPSSPCVYNTLPLFFERTLLMGAWWGLAGACGGRRGRTARVIHFLIA